MNCPADGTVLLMSERQGVEIDYCPQCRGIWLDRGELDKILERVQPTTTASSNAQTTPRGHVAYPARDADSRDREYRGSYESNKAYRKKSNPLEFLGDLFG